MNMGSLCLISHLTHRLISRNVGSFMNCGEGERLGLVLEHVIHRVFQLSLKKLLKRRRMARKRLRSLNVRLCHV